MSKSFHRASGFVVRSLTAAAVLTFGADARAQQPPRPPQQQPQQPGQTPAQPQRPFVGLFEGAPTAPRETLSVQFSGYGGYDQDQVDQSEDAPPRVGDGAYSGFDAQLSFTPPRTGQTTFDARAMSSLRYYASVAELVAATQAVSAGVTFQISPRMTLQTRGGVDYTPYFDYIALPGMEFTDGPDAPLRIPDNTLSTRRVLSFDGGVDLTHAMTDRTSMLLRYNARSTGLINEAQRSLDQTAAAGINHRFDRRNAMRVTFMHRDGRFNVGPVTDSVRVDDLEMAFDRDWARSPTRRTVLSIFGGPSIIEQAGQRSVRGSGGFQISHPFNRSWSVRGLYRRGVQFVTGSGEPFFSNAATFGISGLATRRLDISASVGAVLGDIGLEGGTTPYDTYSASTRFRFAVNRRFAFYGEYLYNYSKYSDSSGLPSLDRTSLRFGLDLFVPLISERPPRRGQQ